MCQICQKPSVGKASTTKKFCQNSVSTDRNCVRHLDCVGGFIQ
nr:MAG TPA: hypothetical protein [Caudoviricetes sp.]